MRCQCSTPPQSASVSCCPPCPCCSVLAFFHQHYDDSRGFFNAHSGIVHQHRICCSNQWGHFSLAVAPIALANFFHYFLQRNFVTFFLMLLPAPFCAHFRGSI